MRGTSSKSPVGHRTKEPNFSGHREVSAVNMKSVTQTQKQEVKQIVEKLKSTRNDNAENQVPISKPKQPPHMTSDHIALKSKDLTTYQTERQPLKQKVTNNTGTRSTSSLVGTPKRKQAPQLGDQSPRSRSPLAKPSPSFGQGKKSTVSLKQSKPQADAIHDSDQETDEQENHSEGQKLLDGLKAVCQKDNEYNTNKLVGEFAKIVHRAAARRTQDFMPENKCSVGSDGRKAIKIGETRIFYDESVISQILDLGIRSKQSN